MAAHRSYRITAVLAAALLVSPLWAQDHYEDLRGDGNPMTLSTTHGDMFLRLNSADKSIKFGLFRQYHRKLTLDGSTVVKRDRQLDDMCRKTLHRIDSLILRGEKVAPASYSVCSTVPVTNARFTDLGWGAYAKAKDVDGTATLFNEGAVNVGTRFSAYGLFRSTRIKEDRFKHSFLLTPSIAWERSTYSLANADTSGAYTFTDRTIDNLDLALAAQWRFFIGTPDDKGAKRTECFAGLSITRAQATNYTDLGKVTLSQSAYRTDTISGQVVTTATTVKAEQEYRTGSLLQYNELRIRLNMALLPALLDRRIAFNLYPSVNLREDEEARFDLGLGINLLQRGDRLLSIGGLAFELSDLTDTGDSDKPLLARGFRIGLHAGINLEGLFAKKTS
ncbi:MAG: hypothetical protein JNL05_11985 [Flavobacteriales bacterium]|nr:hypothetical protein [Flavobacteriales bacterium]